MNRKEPRNGMLEALFNVDRAAEEESLMGQLFSPLPKKGKKRPWARNLEECPHCGSAFPAGGLCPGCGLHDEEMNHGR